MDIWNKEYYLEAAAIAAAIVERDGYFWLADQIRRGKIGRRRWEVQIAMAALMIARGEHELPKPYH